MKFNDRQKLAIETRGNGVKNILVSAGAGSGKTSVLAERVIELITDISSNVDIDNMLIMTFTKNAAAEMRERIAKRLKDKRDELIITSPASDRLKHIQKQLSLLNKASITTIDSFCNTLVKQYFYKADVDPSYRIAGDEGCIELKKISNEVLDELFEEKLEEKDEDFIRLIEVFSPSSYDIKGLYGIINAISSELSSVPFPEKWLKEQVEIYTPEQPDTISPEILGRFKDCVVSMCAPYKPMMEHYLRLAEELNRKYESFLNSSRKSISKFEIYCEGLYILAPFFDVEASETFDYSFIYECLNKPFPAFNRGSTKDVPEELNACFQEMKGFVTECRDNIYKPLKNKVFLYPYPQALQIAKESAQTVRALINLYNEYSERYTRRKKENNVLSFADLSRYCIKILFNDDGTPSDAAYSLRKKYTDVIVDEYQDNNYLQEYILKAVTDDNLFMVGDVKQSIYSFRQACPEIFAKKYNEYEDCFPGNVPEGNVCIKLNQNYRSRKSVLDFSNFLFYQLMSIEFGGIEYDSSAALQAGLEFPEPKEEMGDRVCSCNELLVYEGSNTENTDAADMESDEIYANIIAKRISELIDPQNPCYVFDKKKKEYRPCRLSDIAILMSTPGKVGYIYTNVLGKYGIPTVIKNKYRLFETIEVKTVMSLLKVIDNPYRDIELITLLHSPIFNVSCEELALIKAVDKNGYMYDNVRRYLDKGKNSDLKGKLDRLMNILKEARTLTLTNSFTEVLDRLYAITDYMNYASIIKNGELRIQNLKLLSGMAAEICASGIHDFGGVVNELCGIAAENPERDYNMVSENDNAVNIMSIHASKGLEFPIVFLSQFSKDFKRIQLSSKRDEHGRKRSFFIDADEGLAFDRFDTETRRLFPTGYKHLLERLADNKVYAEYLRLLYVALTRAEEKLIIVGKVSDYEKLEKKASEYSLYHDKGLHLPRTAILNGNSFMDWLLFAYCRKDVLNEELAKKGIAPIDIDEIFKINIVDLDNILSEEFDISYKRAIIERIDVKKADTGQKELDKKLLSRYMDEAAVILPSKISISEIKRQHMIDEYTRLEDKIYSENVPSAEHILNVTEINKDKDTKIEFAKPEFIVSSQTALTGVEKGTAYHTVFEHLKLNAHADNAEIKAQLDMLKEKNILSEAAYNSVNPDKFNRFLHSDLGQRLCASDKVFRETPFVMFLSPKEIFGYDRYGDTKGKVLVHGIIDLYFEEGDYIVLVDYKTDRVKGKNTPEIICDRYKIQLEYYKTAIEKSCDKPVKEMYLYLVDIDKPALVAKY